MLQLGLRLIQNINIFIKTSFLECGLDEVSESLDKLGRGLKG